MIRSLSVTLFACLLFACSGKNKIPGGILAQNEMEGILWDMLSADEFVSGYVLLKNPNLDRKQESLKLYEQIYRIHKVEKEKFRKSLSFYQAHPDLLMEVLDSINAKHNSVTARPASPKLFDSLKMKDKVLQ